MAPNHRFTETYRPSETPASKDPFLAIAANLTTLPKVASIMRESVPALGERSVNVPPVATSANLKPFKDSMQVAAEYNKKKRKERGDDKVIKPEDVTLPEGFASVSQVVVVLYVPNLAPQSYTANQIRAKIRQFVNSGEMKVGEFQDKLGVSPNSYSRFLSQNGAQKGMESDTFWAAAEFFKRREIAGLTMPRAKKAKNVSNHAAGDGDETKDVKVKKDEGRDDVDVSDVKLEGEDKDSVPVYDTCDDIRTKISRFMRETPFANTNSAFIRLISAALPATSAMKPTVRQFPTFVNKKGPTSGADSAVFYASYVFFEKLRVKKNKPKSKKRLQMEEIWTAKSAYEVGVGVVLRDGMQLRDNTKQRFLMQKGEKVHENQYGEISFSH